jgi:hypothetical protein
VSGYPDRSGASGASSVPLAEAAQWLRERNEWQYAISDALDLTAEDHGLQHADLRRCVEEIESLRRQRDEGWQAAYRRGRGDGLAGRPWPPSAKGDDAAFGATVASGRSSEPVTTSKSWWRRIFRREYPADFWDTCHASVEDLYGGTWSCPCGAREGNVCPLQCANSDHEEVPGV